MKKQISTIRNKLVVVRMNEEEERKLNQLFKATTERYLSNYLRKVMLQKPVAVTYRNASADDFLRDMVLLKNELQAVVQHFEQVVSKPPELEGLPHFHLWKRSLDYSRIAVEKKIQEINERITQLYEQWLLK